jgi:aminopeptidase N
MGPGPHGHALPGDRPQWPRDRVVDVRHIKLDLKLDIPNKAISGTVTHSVAALNDGLTGMAFDAMELDIEKVSVAGKAAVFHNDGQKLHVQFPSPGKQGEEFKIAIAYCATPRLGLYFIGPDEAYPDKPTQVWSQCQDEDSRFWFPCYDYPNQKQTTDMLATVPADWYVLSNGRLLEDKLNRDGTRRFHWHQDRPHATYLVTLVAGQFERLDASRDGLTIDYFVEAKDRADGERTFKHTPEMIQLFERITGVAYPWAKYSQVVVRDFVFGGMENTSATTMTENILLDAKAARDHTTDGLISHELAHMWWGDLLTCRDWSHGWLNEGFATYFEMLWNEHHRGIDEYRQEVITNTDLYVGERYRRPIVANVYHEPIDIFDRHLYEKGSLVLHTLRGVLGDDQFFRSLQRYCSDNQDGSVVTYDLALAIERETGRNMEWFFDQWVHKPGHPKFKVSWAWDAGAKLATVQVKQTQEIEDGTPIFRVPLLIDFRTGRSRPHAFDVEIEEKEHTFAFPLPEKPDLCRFDAHNFVLKEIEFEKPLAELEFQLSNDDDIAGRAQAAAGLGKKGGPRAVGALERAVMNDRFWGAKAAAAKALGVAKGSAARYALIRCLTVRDHKARRAVALALGEFRGDQDAFDALAPFSRRDPSYFVEADANRAIGKLRLPGSFDLLAANIGRPSFLGTVRKGCLDGLVELRDERGFELISGAARYGAPHQSRAIAVGALARLAKYFEGRKPAIGDEIAEYLEDPDFRVRIAAANALKALGDPDRAPLLDRMAERELDGRAVRVGREGSQALRTGTETPRELKQLRDDVEKLRAESTGLRERLEKIEGRDRKPG